jgi:hypothetical protein
VVCVSVPDYQVVVSWVVLGEGLVCLDLLGVAAVCERRCSVLDWLLGYSVS